MVGPPSAKEILMVDHPAAHRAPSGQPQPLSGCFVRLGWLAGGAVLPLPFAILIARDERWTLTAKDVAFWMAVALVVSLRYLDWKRFSATSADGELATARDLRCHAAWLVGTWSALWTIAQTLELG
jgi:hypothetical protein